MDHPLLLSQSINGQLERKLNSKLKPGLIWEISNSGNGLTNCARMLLLNFPFQYAMPSTEPWIFRVLLAKSHFNFENMFFLSRLNTATSCE